MKPRKPHLWAVVQKNDPRIVHAVCSSYASASRWVKIDGPALVARGAFVDKTLTTDSFTVAPWEGRK